MNEEKIDRRAHWVQWIAGGLIGATVFCVTLKLTVAQLEQDFKDYRREIKVTLKEQDNREDDLNNRVLILETIQKCRDGVYACGR